MSQRQSTSIKYELVIDSIDLAPSPVEVNPWTKVLDTKKCVDYHLPLLKSALEDLNNQVRSSRAENVTDTIKVLKACGVRLRLKRLNPEGKELKQPEPATPKA